MKIYRFLLLFFIAVAAVSCSNKNDDLIKIIPSDAAGVVSIDLPTILEKGTMVTDQGNFQLPQEVTRVMDNNDSSPLCQLLTDLPVMGIDPKCKVYAFVTTKTFGSSILFALDDEDAARKVVETRTGKDFQNIENIDCIYVEDSFYAIKDDVLFIARVNVSKDINTLARVAASMLSHGATSIAENKEVMECLNAPNDVNAYLQLKGLQLLLSRSNTYREMASRMPLLDVFVESDIKAYVASLNFKENDAVLDVKIQADENSDYIKLLSSTLSSPSSDFLNAIPISMDNIVAMSVKGENLVKLPQVGKFIASFKKIPFVGKLDIEGMMKTIDGPVAAGMVHDVNLDDWNVVIAAHSSQPDAVLSHLSHFAASLGQQPQIYDGEYIYEYSNKMIKLGVKNDVLYMKMLNYEQTEGYAIENNDAKSLFANASMGAYLRSPSTTSGGSFTLGLNDMTSVTGKFTPTVSGTNPVVALLEVLCDIKPAPVFDNVNEVMPGAIDELRPVM